MTQKVFISLVFILALSGVKGQSNFTLYNLNNIVQAQYENPAFRSSARIGVSIIPFSNVVNMNFLNSGFAIEDVLQTRPNSDSLDLTIANALLKMDDINYFDFDMRNEFLAFHYTGRFTSIRFTVNHVLHSSFGYPKGLLELGYYGNGSPETIGQRMALDGIGYNFLSYLEYGAGFSQKIGNKLVVGAKLKYLTGLASLQTETSTFGIYTDPKTFALTIDGAAKINTSNSAAFFDEQISPNLQEALTAFRSITNNGVALDLGVTFDVTDKLHLSGSLIDLGMIKWRGQVANYSIAPFEFEYKGIDLIQYLEDSSQIFDEIIDSLENLTSITESNEFYTTNLYSRFYLSGSYDIIDPLNIGVTWYNSFHSSRYRTGLNVSTNLKLKHWVTLSANYSFYNYGNSNLGFGANLRLGTFQVYALSNSVLALLQPQSTQRLDFSFGMSFQIGKTPEYRKNAADE